MEVREVFSNVLMVVAAALLGSLAIYYWSLLPSNRRFGVFTLAAFCTAFFLEYARVSLFYVGGISWLTYGTDAYFVTRIIIVVALSIACYSVFVRRRRKL